MIEGKHAFGGNWTEAKLQRIEAYLPYFTREMGDEYTTIYFDGFAGTGRVDRRKTKKYHPGGFFPPELFEPRPFDGSAKRALQIDPPFNRYVFIDQDEEHCRELRGLRSDFPELSSRISVRNGNANEKIVQFCTLNDWSKSRAVFFLDPYGMDVNWLTVEAIAKTKASDLWYLFPLNATLRLLQRKGKPPKSRREPLDRVFGDKDWYDEFYHSYEDGGMIFGPRLVISRHADEKSIIKYFVGRLESVFEWVHERPLLLVNNHNSSMFRLFYASAIPGPRRMYDTVKDI